MPALVACPFCREMFEPSEARVCPECGLALEDIRKLPPSREALEDEEPVPPEMETVPFTYVGRGRGPLVMIAVLGLVAFFLPWMRETAPELRVFTGFEFAERLQWMWAPFVSWVVMLPLVLSRRSIHAMRGARLAVGFLAAIVIMTVIMRVAVVPESTRNLPRRFAWAYGLHVTFVLGLLALGVATRFGGRVDDLRSKEARKGDEMLH
ncbi:hypothetical protein [Polyangium sp. 15x6]|uniref:hypothetical protein n=1 Tax=Polyangium sp. 15x6 TaxID=3042687 RepID=UPI00249B53B5|nr:hypothetical protein [Polyangium sp. 15x6]MDI3283195.1 hypothetical protein [Polyangium sp. 15x6]